MGLRVFRENEETKELDAEKLDEIKIEAIESEIRREILERLSEKPDYPSNIAKELGISKQKSYYHFDKLSKADLIEKIEEKTLSGGEAQIYSLNKDALYFDLKGEGQKTFLPKKNPELKRFLNPLIKKGKFNGKIVVGSPEIHGENRVRALDGHLAGNLAAKIGNIAEIQEDPVIMDTNLENEAQEDLNYLILGGIMANTASKRFNGAFPLKFEGESFPYKVAATEKEEYEDPDIGFISKARNPENQENWLYLVAGIGRRGTRGAVKAFQEIENIIDGYESGEFLKAVRALDSDSDGRIDNFEVIE